MKKILLLTFFISAFFTISYGQPTAWINEIHYDNTGGDVAEGVEVVLQDAGSYTLSDFAITFYNGNGGAFYGTITLDQFTEGVTVNGYTIYSYLYSGIQNGNPDGLALSYQGIVIAGQFLSYEGTFTATDGPANTMTSTDMGVSEDGTDATGNSLQLSGTGSYYSDFTWQAPSPANLGSQNNGQSIVAPSADVDPPVWTGGYPQAVNMRDNQGTLVVNMDEPGKAYVIVLYDGATEPNALQVKEGADYDTVHVLVFDSVEVTAANTDYSVILEGASPSTAYDIWVVAQDDEAVPNLQTAPVKVDVTTTAQRSLSITDPQDNAVFSIGDSLTVRWTSANIDSLYLAAYDYGQNDIGYIFEDNGDPTAIMVTPDSVKFRIPHDAAPGDYDLILMDAADTAFQVSVGPITLQDNRVLTWINPLNNTSWYVGDTVTFRWNAVDVDSIIIGGVDYQDTSFFLITASDQGEDVPQAVPASQDTFAFIIPLEASTDSVKLMIYDAEDTSFYDTADPVYIVDTIKPRIATLIPADGSTNAPLIFHPAMVFTEAVSAASGNLYLYKGDGTLVQTYPLTAANNDWSAFVFDETPVLEAGTQYYFTLDPDVVVDNQDNSFGGITDNTVWSFTTAAAQPYFSEYIEGSSYNKALEIYNPTNETIDLNNYALLSTFNGGGFDWTPYPLSGTLAPGEVYTIFNSQFDFSLLADSAAVVDTIINYPITSFNGDDARGLAQLIGGTWDDMTVYSVIDVIGIDTEDPGTAWDVAGVPNATQDHTLLRKPTVTMGNITEGWTASAGTDATNSEWKVFSKDFVSNIGLPSPTASDRTAILGFEMRDTTGQLVSTSVTIDSANATVDVEILYGYGTVADSLVPVITLAPGATSVPASGDTVDFSSPATITVTAEDQITTRDWTVTVTEASTANTETDILSFVLPGATDPVVINATDHTITYEFPYGTDLTALTPDIVVSPGATIVPESGVATDFTDPVTYTVTAQDGSTTQDWTATITAFTPPVVSIYDIQYTADASGDSPYKGQIVQTSGIVTAVNIYQSSFKGYFLQDSAKAWNGIYVYDPDHDATQVGDSVTIVGTVDEYYNLTEIDNVIGYTTVSSGNTLPGPVALTTGEASAEQWEGGFLTITDATCTDNSSLGYDEVIMNDGSGETIVDDFLYNYSAASDFAVDNVYDITGVMNYNYGVFTLCPRSADDISDVTGIQDAVPEAQVLVYPNPSQGRFVLRLTGIQGEVHVSVVNMLGKEVINRQFSVSGGVQELMDMTSKPDGIYFIRIRVDNQTIIKRIVKE